MFKWQYGYDKKTDKYFVFNSEFPQHEYVPKYTLEEAKKISEQRNSVSLVRYLEKQK